MSFSWQSVLDPGDFTVDESGEAKKRALDAETVYGGVDRRGDMARVSREAEGASMRAQHEFDKQRRDLSRQRAGMEGTAAQYGQLGQQYGRQFGALANQYGRIAQGHDSISAEQLRQGLQQQQAAQMSMAAGARPGNQAMAARTAAMEMGRQGYGMSGQQAMAGLQERADARNAQMGAISGGAQARQGFMGGQAGMQQYIGQNQLAQRQQDSQAAIAGQSSALSGYGAIEQQRGNRFGAMMGVNPGPTSGDKTMAAAGTIAQIYAASDRRLKKDIKSGDADAEELLQGLKAYKYSYKDEKYGKGEFVGPMAQELLKTKAGRGAVVKAPDGGLMVHGARLSLALAGAAGNLDRRLRKVEGK
jgi:hypothetical protein